ncbi:hypothetical protein [Spongiibacter marinus]|uniref:hypothetical protein n=1 Tax=Spongiibacter marinus TaxID=354246 RepID=UPI0035BE271F
MELSYYVDNCPSCDYLLSSEEKRQESCFNCGAEFSMAQRRYALENPDLYLSEIKLITGDVKKVIEVADGLVDGKILEIYGVFAVTDCGIECLNHFYTIDSGVLGESHWFEHVSEKTWVNPEDFRKALHRAREIHGIS